MKQMKMLGVALALAATGLATSAAYADDFELKSPVVKDGGNITAKYLANAFGCSGENIRPDFTWSDAPSAARSFAMTFYDRDANTGSGFWHWMMVDIPVTSKSLSANETPTGAKTKANDTGNAAYLAPCPPVGEVHEYVFTLHALNVDKLDAPDNSTAPLTGYFINQHSIGKTTLKLKVSRNK